MEQEQRNVLHERQRQRIQVTMEVVIVVELVEHEVIVRNDRVVVHHVQHE